MSDLRVLLRASEESKIEYEKIAASGYEYKSGECGSGMRTLMGPMLRKTRDGRAGSRIHLGDNLEYMCHLIRDEGMLGKIKMIYIDPPFMTGDAHGAAFSVKSSRLGRVPNMVQRAFEDKWNKDSFDYYYMLALRLRIMHDMLSDDGSIFVHLDWHAVHHVRLLMDEIFGADMFVNEIIWHYKSGGVSRRYYARKHDNILFYSKTRKYSFKPVKEKSYNRGFKPYRFKGVEEFQDDLGWYTLVNKKDVWNIDMVGRSSSERVNYATQKPVALIKQIIESVTEPGDICADFFCGSGSLAAAAESMDRQFICCDMSRLAVSNSVKRAGGAGSSFTFTISEEMSASMESTRVRGVYDSGLMTLKEYSIDLSEVHLENRSVSVAEEVLTGDSLAFIDFWISGYSEDDVFYPASMYFRDKKGELALSSMALPFENKEECAYAFDLFGNMIRIETEK